MQTYKGKEVDIRGLANHIVDCLSLDDLTTAAVDHHEDWLNNLDEQDLADQIESSGFDQHIDGE